MATTSHPTTRLWGEGGRSDRDLSSARRLWQALERLLHLRRQSNPKVELLRRIHLFAGCSDSELRHLATQADGVQFSAGTVLTAEGRRPDTFYMLLDGVVRVQRAGEADCHYGPGAAFDVVAMAELGPARATITTEGAARMLVMSRAQFRAVAGLPRLQDALWSKTSPMVGGQIAYRRPIAAHSPARNS